MRNLSKALSALMTAVILVTGTGCGKVAEEDSVIHSPATKSDNTLTCMVWDRGTFPEGCTADDNTLANWIRSKIKDQYDIELHFVGVDRLKSDDIITGMVDEGTAPDIIFTYSPSVFGYMSQQGKITDLSEPFKNYGENISNYIGDVQYMGQYNDAQAAIIKRRGFKLPRHMAYIRKDFCDALGMSVPSTKKELIDYLYAVKENNPSGDSGLIPWAMGGDIHSERYYQSFINSYVGKLSERDSFIYSERYMVVADGAIDGLRELNRLYNDGIITLDFTADHDNELFKDTVKKGKAGFFVEDTTAPFKYIPVLKESNPTAEFVPVLCFEGSDGNYLNVTEPDFGMYIMVPSASKDKAELAMKYLNWLADPENAELVSYTPEHTNTDKNAPKSLLKDELFARGYPGSPEDYSIVNEHFEFVEDREAQISAWSVDNDWESNEWFEGFYDAVVKDQYTFPKTSVVLEAEAKYQTGLETALVEYAFNLICCPTDEFDSMQESEYRRLQSLGLDEILKERAAYYDSGEIKVGY
ncbi:extracellular solute-binding protein [Butyrivibrio sp. AE3004]|uniref:extracellular solute-binding protein n=1 Tax=Butyrivibrio sp. AE3004 TaxID=1506994 RepID=UPI0004940E9E|nr:extracellular solute-binding protein [Butyrivibrio sp. AE3004]